MPKYSAVCTVCRGKFPWEPSAGYPKSCPLCGIGIGHNRADDDIVMPSIREARTKVIDKTYRDIEAGSEKRVELAAEAAGAPASEMTSLKITDLKDNTRAGETAAASVAANMAALTVGNSKPQFQSNGSEWAAGVNAGYAPRAGMAAQAKIQRAFGR